MAARNRRNADGDPGGPWRGSWGELCETDAAVAALPTLAECVAARAAAAPSAAAAAVGSAPELGGWRQRKSSRVGQGKRPG